MYIYIYISPDGQIATWSVYKSYKDIGFTNHHTEASLSLVDGGFYRSKIKLCFHETCFKPLVSDGFWVLSRPPAGRAISITQNDKMTLDVSFQHFEHKNVKGVDPVYLMDYYEWTLTDSTIHGAMLLPWQRVADFDSKNEMVLGRL